MPTLEQKPEGNNALGTQEYIRRNFDPSDRIAVLVLNRETDTKVQRVVTTEALATERWQAWLRGENARGANVYISYNALRADTQNRTKADVATIRHVYLDLDQDGERSLAAIHASKEIPQPNYVLSTSPGKYQVIWKVEGMSQYQAEALQKRMVEAFGGDPTATDSTRVLRLPGFNNKKYEQDYRVEARELSTATYRLSDFKLGERQAQTPERAEAAGHSNRPQVTAKRTPSDHDWRWAQDRLKSGESIAVLIQRLEDYRYDKPRPQYYARRTVTRAYAKVALGRGDNPEAIVQAIQSFPPNPHENGEQYARQTVQEFTAKLGAANEQRAAPSAQEQQQAQQLALGGDALSRVVPLSRWIVSTSILAGAGLATAVLTDAAQDDERRKPGPEEAHPNSRRAATVLSLITVVVAALDAARFHWTTASSGQIQIVALCALILAVVLQVWAMATNPFFSSAIRTQLERGHQVMNGGPYRFIRHPGYLAMVVLMPATALALDSLVALIPASCYSVLILWRTKREDEFLTDQLAGYAEYKIQVRHRLIPGLW